MLSNISYTCLRCVLVGLGIRRRATRKTSVSQVRAIDEMFRETLQLRLPRTCSFLKQTTTNCGKYCHRRINIIISCLFNP